MANPHASNRDYSATFGICPTCPMEYFIQHHPPSWISYDVLILRRNIQLHPDIDMNVKTYDFAVAGIRQVFPIYPKCGNSVSEVINLSLLIYFSSGFLPCYFMVKHRISISFKVLDSSIALRNNLRIQWFHSGRNANILCKKCQNFLIESEKVFLWFLWSWSGAKFGDCSPRIFCKRRNFFERGNADSEHDD